MTEGDFPLSLIVYTNLFRLNDPDVGEQGDKHLAELQPRDDHGHEPRHAELERLQRVVRVHDGVHDVVHDDEPPRVGRVLAVAVEGEHQDGHVVVPACAKCSSNLNESLSTVGFGRDSPVQEDEGLLPEHDEHRVAELGDLGEDEHDGPGGGHAVVDDEPELRNYVIA